MRMRLGEIVAATAAVGETAPWLGEDGLGPEFSEVGTDSRAVPKGCLFVCIPGERYDGHNFAAEAASKGAAGVMADRPLPVLEDRLPVLLVPDTVRALGRLAHAWRRKAGAKLAAISGSAGKTTVKEMLAAIMAQKAPTAKNYKNFNNLIGLPLSMLAAGAEDRFWVMELGVSLPGEMERLAETAEPDVAVIHNAGPAHLEGFGSVAGVAEAKCALFARLAKGGGALANMDHPELWKAARAVDPLVMGMSAENPKALFYGRRLEGGGAGGKRFFLRLRETEMEFSLPDAGGMFTENVLAAASAAFLLGAGVREIEAGLRALEPLDQRYVVKTAGPFTVIDDTYNANPLSMRRSIRAAREEAGDGPLVLALGEMREMGEDAAAEHEKLGAYVASIGCDVVFFRGGFASALAGGLQAGGYMGKFAEVGRPEEVVRGVEQAGLAGGTILFKGSRSLRMEEYVQAFFEKARGMRG